MDVVVVIHSKIKLLESFDVWVLQCPSSLSNRPLQPSWADQIRENAERGVSSETLQHYLACKMNEKIVPDVLFLFDLCLQRQLRCCFIKIVAD